MGRGRFGDHAPPTAARAPPQGDSSNAPAAIDRSGGVNGRTTVYYRPSPTCRPRARHHRELKKGSDRLSATRGRRTTHVTKRIASTAWQPLWQPPWPSAAGGSPKPTATRRSSSRPGAPHRKPRARLVSTRPETHSVSPQVIDSQSSHVLSEKPQK